MALVFLAACGGQGQVAPRAAMSADAAMPADATGFAFAAQGGALVVARAAKALTYSDGLAAKRAALAHCAAQGAQLNPAAFGRFAGGTWQFAGGCQ